MKPMYNSMEDEIRLTIKAVEAKLEKYEVGGVQHNMYMEIRKELQDKLGDKPKIKLHVDEEAVCTSCQ